MHIPDGFIDPRISYGLMGAAVAALSYCLAKVKASVTALAPQKAFAAVGQGMRNISEGSRRMLTKFGEQKIYQMGMVASLVFAAQMFNFPVALGTSGHLIGGVLSVVLLGPYAGAIVVAAVLIIQSLFFADGGLIVLGANIINMAFIAGLTCYYIYSFLKKYVLEWQSIAITAWLSVVLAALATSLQIGFSGTHSLSVVMRAMLQVHVVIGLAEALITIVLIKTFRKLVPKVGEE